MSRGKETSADELVKLKTLLVLIFLDQFERCVGVLFSVQGKSGTMSGEAFAICVFGILFLQPGGIGQHYFQTISGCVCCVDSTSEAVTNEPRKIARVIDVCVSQQDGSNRCGIDRERPPVSQPQFLEALKQSAVNHCPGSVGLQ